MKFFSRDCEAWTGDDECGHPRPVARIRGVYLCEQHARPDQ